MATRPYLRSSLARSLFEKMMKDENLRCLDKSKWYDINTELVSPPLQALFFQSQVDEETETFLQNSFDKSDWLFTQMMHALVRAVLCWFMSRTSINGLLNRGSMFVFSSSQFEAFAGPFLLPDWKSRGRLVDLGAGDGLVTQVMAAYFDRTYATEVSPVMRNVLAAKNYTVLEVDNWTESGPFSAVGCLNLLDRCDSPITLMKSIRDALDPQEGLLILALVLPLSQHVESGARYVPPSERIEVSGRLFEEQVASLATGLFQDTGFELLRWTRLPYLCEGDMDQAFYWLDDALFLLKVAPLLDPSEQIEKDLGSLQLC